MKGFTMGLLETFSYSWTPLVQLLVSCLLKHIHIDMFHVWPIFQTPVNVQVNEQKKKNNNIQLPQYLL